MEDVSGSSPVSTTSTTPAGPSLGSALLPGRTSSAGSAIGEPTLNEHERYLFDLQGFLAVPDVLDRPRSTSSTGCSTPRSPPCPGGRHDVPLPVAARLGHAAPGPHRSRADRPVPRRDPRRVVPTGSRVRRPDPARQGADRDTAPRRVDAVRSQPVLPGARRQDPQRPGGRGLQPLRRESGRRRVRPSRAATRRTTSSRPTGSTSTSRSSRRTSARSPVLPAPRSSSPRH